MPSGSQPVKEVSWGCVTAQLIALQSREPRATAGAALGCPQPCWAGPQLHSVELLTVVVLLLVEVCPCVVLLKVDETLCVSIDKWLLSPWLKFSYRPLNPLVSINCVLLQCKKCESSCWNQGTVFLMQPLISKMWKKINSCYKRCWPTSGFSSWENPFLEQSWNNFFDQILD